MNPQPAAPLDAEPVIYRGLGITALIRVLVLAVLVLLIPTLLASVMFTDGFGSVMMFITILLPGSVVGTMLTAGIVRRIQQGRPKNWINRSLASRLPAPPPDLIQHHYWSK